MLTRLKVQGYKALRDLDVSFGQLTVLVGPNGCGKSSVLGAISLLRDLTLIPYSPDPVKIPVGIESRSGGPNHEVAPICIDMSGRHERVDISTVARIVPELRYRDTLDAQKSSVEVRYGDEDYAKDWNKTYVPARVEELLGSIGEYRLDASLMARPIYSEEARPRLESSGQNLAAVLDALQGEHRERFESIEEELCRFIPGLRRVRLHRVSMPIHRKVLIDRTYQMVQDNGVGHQVVLDFDFARSIAADQASEGTLLLLGLLTIIGVEPDTAATVMLDDLDRALHPKAQQQLIEHLHALLDQRPGLQIIATSHSPYLVEHLAYEEVLAMTQSRVDGRSLAAPLAEHPEAPRWKEEMSAGEFWSSMGEEWIEQGRAASE